MRPGRLDRILYVSPPDLPSRKEIFRVNFRKMAVRNDVDVDELALIVRLISCWLPDVAATDPFTQTEGCSGAEIVSICQDAALNAMNENLEALDVRSCCLRHSQVRR